MKFEEYMTETLKKICEGQPYNRALWKARILVYFGLIARGVEPEKARRMMDLYLEGD